MSVGVGSGGFARPGAARQGSGAPERPLVLVACSGGADSMALASALAFEAPKLGVRAGGITVDHGLQPGSDLRAEEVALRLRELGLDPVDSVAVTVGRDGGPEAAARDARYAALDAALERHGGTAVLLGHTRDDQAETVLLGLARGSGIRSLSGMAAVSGADGRYRRPFLQLDRQTARKACMVQSLPVWDDPHNADPAYTRSRLRHEGLPALEACWSARSSTPCRPPYAAGSCAGPPSRPVPRPVPSSPGTSRRSTVSSPAGAVRGPSISPAGSSPSGRVADW
jgi:tRNA(Ile)-lysidine synthase